MWEPLFILDTQCRISPPQPALINLSSYNSKWQDSPELAVSSLSELTSLPERGDVSPPTSAFPNGKEGTLHKGAQGTASSTTQIVANLVICPEKESKTQMTAQERPWPWLVWLSFIGVSSPKPKSRRFNFQSGHMPRLWVQSLVRVHSRGNQLIFLSHINVSLSLSPFLLLSL